MVRKELNLNFAFAISTYFKIKSKKGQSTSQTNQAPITQRDTGESRERTWNVLFAVDFEGTLLLDLSASARVHSGPPCC